MVCAFLPQTGLLLPFAAFFVLAAGWFAFGREQRGYGAFLLAGALLGLAAAALTGRALERTQTAYAGREAVLAAEVEQVSASYYPGVVRAVLRVEEADGKKVRFRIEVAALPKCETGTRVKGRFALEAPDRTQALSTYADGIALSGECLTKLTRLGESGSFRARTARLQKRLSAALRQGMPQEPAGVLAAMVVGDRSILSKKLKNAYRAAGLSHVLVISGMHVSILCGDLFGGDEETFEKRKERSYASRRAKALFRALLALLLVGVTGFTPSVLRAAGAVWISALGVWVYGAPDALTSLGVAGVVMTLGNSYAVCDVGFELSFAAVLGTLAGAELARRGRAAHRVSRKKAMPQNRSIGPWKRWAAVWAGSLWETVCVSGCASAATFPVLVLRGMSASLYALVSSVAVLWMVEPILLLGLATALLGFWPMLAPVQRLASLGAVFLTDLLDRWALWVSGWPGAQLWFDTAYAALVCLILMGLAGLALYWKVRLRVALPALVLTAALAIGAGNAWNKDVVRVELAGSRNAPAVVLSQGDRAVILFRGGESTQRAVETVLDRRGIRKTELLVDLRMNPKTSCTLEAAQTISTAEMDRYTTRKAACGPAELEILRTYSGCVVRVTVAGQQLVTLSGTVQLAKPVRADWLLASSARPDAVRYKLCLALSDQYRWMEEGAGPESAARLLLRPGGGMKLD